MAAESLVSVIIPLYNAAPFIEQCIQSILAQTWPNIEIIIVDDGSTDNSYEIARQFEGDKVKIIKQPNNGASVARNSGLKVAKGEYIQFMDADDLLSADKIEKQVRVLQKNKGCIAVCDTAYFDDGTDPHKAQPLTEWYTGGSDDPADFLIKLYGGDVIGQGFGGMVQPNCWLTPRTLIEKAGPWNEMRCPDDDGEFFCRVILAAKGIRYVTGVHNYYRKFYNHKSLSGQKTYDAFKSMLIATDLKAQHLLAATDDKRAKMAMGHLYWENVRRCYPAFKDLADQAEKSGKALFPEYKFRPYAKGIKSVIATLLGWKLVRIIENTRAKLNKPAK